MTGMLLAGTSVCVGKEAGDDDDEFKEGVDVLDRRDRFAKAAVVFSRAIAAMDNRLYLARLDDGGLRESRGREGGGRGEGCVGWDVVDVADEVRRVEGQSAARGCSRGGWSGTLGGNETSLGGG